MHESGESNTTLVVVPVLVCEPFAFRVVVTQWQRTIEQAAHVDLLANHLTRGGGFAFVNEVASPKFFRRQAHRARNVVHVTLECEDALRRAKAAKRAVRRNIGGERLAANTHVRTNVRSGRMNCSARKNDRREGAVSTAVDNKLDLHCQKFSVFRHGGLVPCARGMSLCR